MNRQRTSSVVGLILWLLAAAVSHAQQGVPGPPRSGVVVQVHGRGDRGVADAAVELLNAAGLVIGVGATNVDGIVRMADVPPGSYQVRIRARGFSPGVVTV